ncbi:hypothetical protein Dsin_008933 [Dipteronia sinensis]|uniref:Reverse transcriptase domain-containing protein n=1 Tax=Dipteronia sinensis TaxID=43782 RepID=A0AAE0APN0_9ROSI|nr:hypothetical protein Dsin_008933 [Dipteronia sinensis]
MLMKDFIKSSDEQAWLVVKKDFTSASLIFDGVVSPKPKCSLSMNEVYLEKLKLLVLFDIHSGETIKGMEEELAFMKAKEFCNLHGDLSDLSFVDEQVQSPTTKGKSLRNKRISKAKSSKVKCKIKKSKEHSPSPLDSNLRTLEKELISCYTMTLKAEEDLLRQKSRIQWLKAGDRNSSYFFKAINGKRNRSKIHTTTGDVGSLIEGDILVKIEAIRHFQTILGYSRPVSHGSGTTLSNIIDKVISNRQADFMGRDVTDDEIREVCFSLHPNKAPGPDGFNAHFFKITWDIVGEDFINAIQEFFRSGLLLKELNATILALVPKVPNPSKMKDFRPISCCNTLYKIIAKIIANRIKPCLPDIISPSQSAFVAGRCIGDNILLVQELMRNYHKNASCPRLALKMDLMKAFDMVDWGFLLETLAAFHFPPKVIIWIKACLTTPKFSISINGEVVGFFSGKRGLRQGDPMSPYLFVIAMEVLSKILAKCIEDFPSFKFHWRCDKIKLSHICFADDLIMLCHGSLSSARVIKAALDEFSLLSGLHVNHAKSNIFNSGVSHTINQQLINLFGYTVGSLPIRYLGIPIISSRLRLRDWSPLWTESQEDLLLG